MSQDEVVLIPMAAAARLISVSRSRAYALAARGQLPGAIRLGGTWRVNRRTLEAWAARAAVEWENLTTSVPGDQEPDKPRHGVVVTRNDA
jgi:excisionase family DNA binding protein